VLTTLNGDQVTHVTIIEDAGAQTFTFCANVADKFPTGRFVTATYKHSTGCDVVENVVGSGG
jgi:hypothetical protein